MKASRSNIYRQYLVSYLGSLGKFCSSLCGEGCLKSVACYKQIRYFFTSRSEVSFQLPVFLKNLNFTITALAEFHARSLANFYCQYADRHMNLKFMRRVSEREPAIPQFVIVNKLTSVFNASVLLLIMNFVIALSK